VVRGDVSVVAQGRELAVEGERERTVVIRNELIEGAVGLEIRLDTREKRELHERDRCDRLFELTEDRE